jgi:hypothetical protein
VLAHQWGRRFPSRRADRPARRWSRAEIPGADEQVSRSPRPAFGWPIWSAEIDLGILYREAGRLVKSSLVSLGRGAPPSPWEANGSPRPVEGGRLCAPWRIDALS